MVCSCRSTSIESSDHKWEKRIAGLAKIKGVLFVSTMQRTMYRTKIWTIFFFFVEMNRHSVLVVNVFFISHKLIQFREISLRRSITYGCNVNFVQIATATQPNSFFRTDLSVEFHIRQLVKRCHKILITSSFSVGVDLSLLGLIHNLQAPVV